MKPNSPNLLLEVRVFLNDAVATTITERFCAFSFSFRFLFYFVWGFGHVNRIHPFSLKTYFVPFLFLTCPQKKKKCQQRHFAKGLQIFWLIFSLSPPTFYPMKWKFRCYFEFKELSA